MKGFVRSSFLSAGLMGLHLALSLPAVAQESPSLALESQAEEKPQNIPKKQKSAGSFFAVGENKSKSEKDLTMILSGLNTLIKTEKSATKKNDLIMSRALTLLSLGKNLYLQNRTPENIQKKDNYLKRAMGAATEAGNLAGAPNTLKAKALQVHGMAALYMDNDAKAVEHFEQALKMDPSGALNPRLSVFVAEYYFDKEKYEIALPFYSQYFTRLTQEERALALYKSAWCFFVTKQYDNAEKAFMKLIGKPWAGDFATDSLRDLAQTVTSHLNEQQVLQFGRDNFTKENQGLLAKFYTDSYMIFLRQSANVDRPALYEEVLRIEPLPEKRVAIALKKMSSHQKGFATSLIYSDIQEVEGLIQKGNLKPETESFKVFASELELELKRAISSHVDTVAKKVKSPETLPDLEWSKRLQKLLWYHINWFPNSESLTQTYMISLDNCSFIKDPGCTLKTGQLILNQPKLKSVWPRAKVEILLALETMSSKDPGLYKLEFHRQLKSYADNEITAKEWPAFTKKLTVIYLDEKRPQDAEPYLIRIYQKENTPENLYRKIYCQFQLKKYKEIMENIKAIPKEGSMASEIKTVMRETSLLLAKEEISKKNFIGYEKFLTQFLTLDPSPEKADLARSDYLEKLIEQKSYDKVLDVLQKMPAEKRFAGAFAKPMELLLLTLFSMNRFPEALGILGKEAKMGQFRDFDSYWFRSSFAMNGTLGENDLKLMSTSLPSVRLGLLSLAAISNPEVVFRYFKTFPAIDEKEKRVWLLAKQMSEGARELLLSPSEIKGMAGVLGGEVLPVGVQTSERLARMIEFPQVKWSQEKLAKVTPEAMDRVKTLRRQLMRDLKNLRVGAQKRLILNAINVEKKMAWFFDESPVPQGLSPEELAEYKKEIDNFASEYYLQIAEYQKLLSSILSIQNKKEEDRIPLPISFEKWTKPKTSPFDLVDAEIRQNRRSRALILLESLKNTEKVNLPDYYRWRSYGILTQFPHDFAASYVQDELLFYKQSEVLSEWKKTAGLLDTQAVEGVSPGAASSKTGSKGPAAPKGEL